MAGLARRVVVRLWRAGIRVLLAAVLLFPGAGPARAEASAAQPPRPGLKPLLLEPLVWDEACEPAHTRVELPVGRMSARMREARGLPRTADPARWSPGAVLLLGRAYETGELGMPDAAEAARLYCLLLRHHGSRMGAFLLSRLHARGAGVAFSPALADHFARVAAVAWSAATYRDDVAPQTAAGELPNDGIVIRQLAEAEAWLASQETAPLRARHRTVKRHLAGGPGPRSEMLVEALYRDLAYAAEDNRETADITFAYFRHRLRTAPEMLEVGHDSSRRWIDFSMLTKIADELDYTPAQVLLGELHAHGRGLPRDPVAAVLWLSRARANGADVASEIATLLEDVQDDLRPALRAAAAVGLTPRMLLTLNDVKSYRALLAKHFGRSE
jgi:TPR repeat protein